MSKNAPAIVLLGTMVLVFAGCTNSGPARSYKDKAERFGMNVPADWEQAPFAMGAKVAFLAPPGPSGFKSNINVVILPATGFANVEALLAAGKKQLENFSGYTELVAEVVTHSNGKKACLIEADHTMMKTPLRIKQYSFIHNKKAYTVTATMPTAEVGKWMDQVDEILDSFIVW